MKENRGGGGHVRSEDLEIRRVHGTDRERNNEEGEEGGRGVKKNQSEKEAGSLSRERGRRCLRITISLSTQREEYATEEAGGQEGGQHLRVLFCHC